MELAPNVRLIEGLNSGKFPYCNVLKVGGLLIDAGAGIDIVRNLAAEVDVMILSHTHPDHASGAWIFNELRKPVFAPEGVETDLDSLARRFAPEIAEDWKKLVTSFGMRSFEAESYGEGIVWEEPEVEAIAVPGHTIDHHVFLIDGKALYAADIDLTSFGPFYGNPEASIDDFVSSAMKLLELDVKIFVSAHSKPVFGRERIEEAVLRYLNVIEERDRRILELLSQPRSIEEIVEISPIYGRKPYAKVVLDYFEGVMVAKHLQRLKARGVVEEEDGKYVRIIF